MGACGSTVTTPQMVDQRRRELATLKEWRRMLAASTDEERHMRMVKGHQCCGGLTWCVYRSNGKLDDSFDSLNRIAPEADDWMVLMSSCGTPLYLSCLLFGPLADRLCPKKSACQYVQDNVKRNFDDQNLTQRLPKTTRLALDVVHLYHTDLHPVLVGKKKIELPKNHWSMKARWCRGCRDAHGNTEEETNELAEDGLLATNSPSTQTHTIGQQPANGIVRIDHNGNPIRNHGERRPSTKHATKALVCTIAIPHGTRPHGSLSASPEPSRSRAISRHPSRPGSRAGSRPGSRAGSRKGSRENSPERSRKGGSTTPGGGAGGVRSPPSQHHHLAHSTSLPYPHGHLVGLQRGGGSHPAGALPMLPIVHTATPTFPVRALSPNSIHLELPSAKRGMSRAHSEGSTTDRSATRTEWVEGDFLVTNWGNSDLTAVGIHARITNEDGEPDAQGDWLSVTNQTNHAVVFSAPNVGDGIKLTPGTQHEYPLTGSNAVDGGKGQTVQMHCKYALTSEI